MTNTSDLHKKIELERARASVAASFSGNHSEHKSSLLYTIDFMNRLSASTFPELRDLYIKERELVDDPTVSKDKAASFYLSELIFAELSRRGRGRSPRNLDDGAYHPNAWIIDGMGINHGEVVIDSFGNYYMRTIYRRGYPCFSPYTRINWYQNSASIAGYRITRAKLAEAFERGENIEV